MMKLRRFDNPTEDAFYRHNPQVYTIKSEPINFIHQRKLSRYLGQLWLGLNIDISKNQVLLFPRVGSHNDSGMQMGWSTVFIPLVLPGNEDAIFKHTAHPEEDFSLRVGDIVLFNQNLDHSLAVAMGPVDNAMSYGLSFYIDKLPPKEKEKEA